MSRSLKKSEMNHFLPGGLGIETPHPHDILSGRGGASNNHMGNKIYRTVCEHNKGLYAAAPRNEKLPIAVAIVEAVRSRCPPGRFLERRKEDKLWYEVTEKRAIDKTAQALREKVHKAIMLPLGEIPEDFAHLVGEETEAAALAAAEQAAAGAPAPKPRSAAAATRTKKRKPSSNSSRSKTGKKTNGGNKKVKLDDERFALPSKLRNISFGGLFQSSGSAPASAGAEPVGADSRSDTTGSQLSMQPLPGAGMGPPLETNSTHTDSNLLVETALAPTTSLFNFFGLLGRGTSSSGGDVGGKSAGAASASAGAAGAVGAASAAGAAAFADTGDDDRKPAASAAASLEKSPRSRAKCLTAATADARAVVETQAAVRETSLTRDISSFLPSFLERGLTGLAATATSLSTGISGVFSGSSGGSMPSPRRNVVAGGGDGAGVDSGGCISQITQGGGAVAAPAAAPAANAIGVGSDDLVVPPPPSGGLNRGNTLTGDDDFEEDPSLERLRMIPPALSGPKNNGAMSMPMSIPRMPADDRKRSSLL